jgi:hypothetical protein
VIDGTSGANQDIAHLVKLVNGKKDDEAVLKRAFEVLKAIEAEGLTYSTEQDLDEAIERIEQGES